MKTEMVLEKDGLLVI